MRPYDKSIKFDYPYLTWGTNSDPKRDDQQHFNNGLHNMRWGHYKQAVEDFSVATHKSGHKNTNDYHKNTHKNHEPDDPTSDKSKPNANAYRWRARAQFALKEYELAIADYKRAIAYSDQKNCFHPCKVAAKKDLATVYCYRAMLRLTNEEYDNALTDFSEAQKENDETFLAFINNDYKNALKYASYSTLSKVKEGASNPPIEETDIRVEEENNPIKDLLISKLKDRIEKIRNDAKVKFDYAKTNLEKGNYNAAFNICTIISKLDKKLLLELMDTDDFLETFENAVQKIDTAHKIKSVRSKLMDLLKEDREVIVKFLPCVFHKEAQIYFPAGNKWLGKRHINYAFKSYFNAMKNVNQKKQLQVYLGGFKEALKAYDSLSKLEVINNKLESLKESLQRRNFTITNLMQMEVVNRINLINMLTNGSEELSKGNHKAAFDYFCKIKSVDKSLLLKFFGNLNMGRFKKALKKIEVKALSEYDDLKDVIQKLLHEDSTLQAKIVGAVETRALEAGKEIGKKSQTSGGVGMLDFDSLNQFGPLSSRLLKMYTKERTKSKKDSDSDDEALVLDEEEKTRIQSDDSDDELISDLKS